MNKLAAVVGAAALGLSAQAGAATYSAPVTVTFGDVANDGAAPGTGPTHFNSYECVSHNCYFSNFDGSGDALWTSNGANAITLSAATTTILSQAAGASGTSFYNTYDETVDGLEDYTSVGQPNCIAANAISSSFVKPYSCLDTGSFTIYPIPVKGIGPAATASGTLSIDTTAGTITGVLTIAPYSYRSADGSPFNAYRLRYSGAGTMTVNWTATFTPSSWTITGGTAIVNDPTGTCTPGDTGGTLCNPSAVLGGHQSNLSETSWISVPIWDKVPTAGGSLQFTVPGVVGTVTPAAGALSGSGEFHRAIGSSQNGCSNQVVYNPVQQDLVDSLGNHYLANITCGTINAGIFSVVSTGAITGPDSDGDGIPDAFDNCSTKPNADQHDANGDGYGNVCDADLDNNGSVTATDFAILRGQLGKPVTPGSLADASDLDVNGSVSATDFAILRKALGSAPGPSGLH